MTLGSLSDLHEFCYKKCTTELEIKGNVADAPEKR